MRIRKRGNPQTSESSGALQRLGGIGGGSHQQEQLGVSSLPVAEAEANASTDEGEHGIMRRDTGEDDPLRWTGVSSVNAAIHETAGVGGGMTSRAPPPTLVVDLLQSSGRATTFNPSETYMNLDEFVDSLARENCFPADDSTSHPRGSTLMSMLHKSDLHFERLANRSSPPPRLSTYAELDTSLRLGQASHPIMAPTQERGKSKMDFQKESESSSESDGSENLSREFLQKSSENWRAGRNAGTTGDAGTSRDPELESRNERNAPRPSHVEMFDESDMAQRPVSDIEAVRRELESSPSDQLTRKSSTESMERAGFSRKRRVSEEPASSKRRRISSPAPITTEELLAADHPAKQSKGSLMFSLYTVYHDAGREGLTAGEAISTVTQQALPGFEESECRSRRHVTKLLRNSPYFMELGEGKFALCSAMIDAEEDDPDPDPNASEEAGGSDSSNRSGGASTLPVSSSSLAMTDSEKRKQEVELERKASESGGGGGTTAAAGTASSQQTERKPSGRSGRPKRLKYLKQDNVEELGNQCNRSDGKGWTCPLLAKTGYQLCDHHLDKLRCKPGSRSKYNKKKKKKHN